MEYEVALNKQGRHCVFTDSWGYVWVTAPAEHPRASKKYRHKGKLSGQGYVKRAVLVCEKSLGRLLAPGESVHHINGDKCDDRPENLSVCSHSEHSSWHSTFTPPRRRVGVPREGEKCSNCPKILTSSKHDRRRGLCNACYLRAKREKGKTGSWPEFATRYARANGSRN